MVTKVINVEVREDGLSDLNNELNKVEKNFKDVERSADKTSAGLKDVGKNGGAIAVLDELTGGLATKTRDVAEATELFNFKLKGVRTALIATGIGAFVVALGVIVAYWDEIVNFITLANEKLEMQIKRQDDILKDLDGELKLLEVKQKILEAEGKSTDEIVKQKEAILLIQQEENTLLLEKLKTQLEIESSQVKEVTFWEQQKINALEALGFYDRAAKARAEALIGNEDERAALSDLEQRIKDATLRNEQLKLNLLTLRNGGTTSDKKEKEEDVDIIPSGRVKDFTTKLGQLLAEGRQTALEELRATGLQELEAWQNTEQAKTAIAAYEEGEREKLRQRGADLAQQIADAEADYKVGVAMTTLNALASLAEQGSAGAKAIAITQAVISTYQGINKALAETTDFTPSQTLRFANAAAVGLAGFANVANILKSNPSGSARPNISGVGGGGGGVSAPSFNVVGTSGVNQLAESLQQDQQPIEAYVVANNVTTAQSLNNNIVQTASIG